MFERIKNLYDTGRLDINGLRNAVIKGLITAEQYYLICGEPYEEPVEDNSQNEVEENGSDE